MTRARASCRLLAAPILGERGGGVGQVSALLWRAFQDTWGDDAELLTLLRNGHSRPGAADKLRFGAAIAARHALHQPEWILFSHLGLLRAERYVPVAWQSPYAVFLHGIECWEPLSAADLAMLNRASLRIANSDYTARRAREANPRLSDIVVCPLALPGPVPTVTGHQTTEPVVLVVGRLSSGERYKGHSELIQAWPDVLARVPSARLRIVGEGDDLPALRQLAQNHGVSSAVEFLGFVTREQLHAEYGRASVFALPSRGEGFGLVYLEAMAHGLPCIGSRSDAAAEVIVDGVTGVLVDVRDGQSLQRKLCDLLENPLLARAFGEAGRKWVRDHFSYERFRSDIVKLLDEAFEDGSAIVRASA